MPVTLPTDQLLLGKLPFIQNGRVNKSAQFDSRLGYNALVTVGVNPLHSIRRLNDQVPGAAQSLARVLGQGTAVSLWSPSGLTIPDNGYSGDPLSLVTFRPERSVEPWMYIFDRKRMRKVRADGTFFNMGIAPPLAAPSASLGSAFYNLFADAEVVGGWVNGGTLGALAASSRFNNAGTLLWDDLSTTGPGWASFIPTVWRPQFTQGADVTFTHANFTTQEVIIQASMPAPDTATILSIAYDAGATGFCTIHASVSSQKPPRGYNAQTPGRLSKLFPKGYGDDGVDESGISDAYLQYLDQQLAWVNSGYVPDAVISFPGGFGRVHSVVYGKDGTSSIRLNLSFTATVGQTMTGVPSVRVFIPLVMHPLPTATGHFLSGAATPGLAFATLVGAQNLGQVSVGGGNVRPIQDSDYLHISILLADPASLIEGKLLLDVDLTTNDFTQNFYEISFTAHDLQPSANNQQTKLTTKGQIIQRSLYDFSDGDYRKLYSNFATVHNKRTLSTRAIIPRPIATPRVSMVPGKQQWSELKVRISDLQRIGADLSRTLANVASVRVQFNLAAADTPSFDSLWVGGTFGPDVGTLGAPILYRYRYRSSTTGARSLCGPPTRSGLTPHNQSVLVAMAASGDPQFDKYDVYRWGGTIVNWTYIGTQDASFGSTFADVYADDQVAAQDLIETDTFQPFPTLDIPRAGVCNVVGTRINRASGDLFNLNWYPGSEIYINGILTNLYAQPSSINSLEVVDNMGTQTGVSFLIPQATLLAQPLPCAWGPSPGNLVVFAVGDLYQPGVLFYTNGNDPDAASDLNQLELSSPSEPLMNGALYDDLPFVFSTERCWVLYPDFQSLGKYDPIEVKTGRGLFTRWMLATGKKGIYFGGKDGIYRTNYGPAESITDESLYPLFPHGEDSVGNPVLAGGVTINPPDFVGNPTRARLSFVGDLLYFDYVDTQGVPCTWVYDEKLEEWVSFDVSTPGMVIHYFEEGTVRSVLAGGVDGKLYQSGGTLDGTTPIAVLVGSKQPVSHGMEQYGYLRDGQIDLAATSQVTLQITLDGIPGKLITIASTAGLRKKTYVPGVSQKGKLLEYVLATVGPFRLFPSDAMLRLGPWAGGGLQPVRPFIGEQR